MMYIRILVVAALVGSAAVSSTAQPYLSVSWKGELGSLEVPIDSVQVTNLTKDWTTTVYYPENSVKLYHSVGIKELDFANMQIRVKPNPFSQTATVEFYVRKEEFVSIRLYDIFGRTVASMSQQMECGQQQVLVNAGSSGYYFLAVETPTEKRVAKLLCMGDGGSLNHDFSKIEKINRIFSFNTENTENHRVTQRNNLENPENLNKIEVQTKGFQKSDHEDYPFEVGDSMQFVAFATDNGRVHTYLPQSYKILEDKDLLFIYNPVSTVDYSLDGCEWDFSSMQEDSIYVIYSEQELLEYIICTGDSTPPAIDFTRYSLLLAHGNTEKGSISIVSKKMMQLSADCYTLDIEINISDTAEGQPWYIAMLVPKAAQNAITSNIQYIGTRVLMLEVDYVTYAFKGGKELVFPTYSDSFTITGEFGEPMDGGYMKLFYKEINELLFSGIVMRMAWGYIVFPDDMLSPDLFQRDTNNYVYPQNGIELAFDCCDIELDLENYFFAKIDSAWNAVQSLAIVREYLQLNPEQKVKITLYPRCIGAFDPYTSSWIIHLKR